MKRLFLLIVSFLLFFQSQILATHIIGGSITYEHLGGSTYRVTLKVYRDCKAGSAYFDKQVQIEVRGLDGATFTPSKDILINLQDSVILNPNVDTCVTKPNLCITEATYSTVVNNLPPAAGGYHLYWRRCCRNSTILNITTPLTTGEAFYAYIPDNSTWLTNSSPQWVNPPPVFVCQGVNINYSYAATDKDGDSLVYTYYHPFLGCDQPTPIAAPNCPNPPTFPGNVATFPLVTYQGGYSPANPLGGGGLTISTTGLITGIPPMIGQFVVAVKCTEYRNGQMLSYIVRDFQFNVVNCPPPAIAGIGPINGCSGQSITFTNTSTPNAVTFFWDFGDPGSTTDTSYKKNPPAYVYPGLGPYIVRLITQYGTNCADTAYQTVNISSSTANFNTPATVCAGSVVTFTNTSTTTPNSSINAYTWSMPGGTPSSSGTQNPSVTYNSGGSYTITLTVSNSHGCPATISKTITVQARPTANAGIDLTRCKNNAISTLNGNITNAGGGTWTGSGGTFTPNPNVLNPTYTPSPGELTIGSSTLVLTSTGNGVCPAAKDTVRITYTPAPTVNAGPDKTVCKDTSGIPLSGGVTVATGGIWTSSGTGTFSPLPNVLNPTYIPSSSDTALNQIRIILSSTGNGNCAIVRDTLYINFSPTPKVYITATDTSCSGVGIPLIVTTTTGGGIWTSTGTGTFTPSNTVLNPTYNPSPADTANGKVIIRFISTNNGGCKPKKDSIEITLLPGTNVNFTHNTGCQYTAVQFNNTSTGVGVVTGWLWRFGDGSTGNTQNPSHLYNPAGTYTVTLITTTNKGCVDSVKKVITVQPVPVANFNANPLCIVDSVTFTNTSTIPAPGVISGWTWNFGDPSSTPNNTSNLQNPQHYFTGGPGTYSITLTARSANGCLDTIVKTITIQPAPVANFTANNGCDKQAILFNDGSTIGPGGTIGTWTWNFGDPTSNPNNTSGLQNPTHVFSGPGTYSVTLIAISTNGCRDTVVKTVTIHPLPVANFVMPPVCIVDSVRFANTSTISGGTITSWTWNFGDPGSGPNNTSNLQNPAHYYSTSGTYTVSLIVRSALGCLDTIVKTITVSPKPTANFTNTNSTCLGNSILFNNTSTIAPGGTITSWSWSFGNGNTSTSQSPTYTYPGPGTYSVTLIVTSNLGCTDTIQKTITILDKPKANFYYTGGCFGSGTRFFDSSTVVGGTIVWWKWVWGDGKMDSLIKNPTHTYPSSGNYPVTLIVRSNQGCYDTITKVVSVLPPPTAAFTMAPNPALAKQTVQFTDQSKTNIVVWKWNFGDKDSSSLQHPTHAYNVGGRYTVTLIVRDINGCVDTVTHEILITLPPNIPNGFSPNKDGKNDKLFVLGGPYKNLEFRIYNNWGELIFTSYKQSDGWDGTRENIPQPVGVYIYTVVVTTEDDKNYTLSGDVTLLR